MRTWTTVEVNGSHTGLTRLGKILYQLTIEFIKNNLKLRNFKMKIRNNKLRAKGGSEPSRHSVHPFNN